MDVVPDCGDGEESDLRSNPHLRFTSSGSGGIKWWIQAAEMSFLCRTQSQRPVAELEGEPLLLRVLKGVS